MSKALVVVESPAKARTIARFLGSQTTVLASNGHIRDLPESSLGVDIQNHFSPQYVVTPGGSRALKNLRKAAGSAQDVYLATDHDREGEAIAWHLEETLKGVTKGEFHRVVFHEITRGAIQASFAHPGKLDPCKVAAQQARRVLDRLVGYQVSPLLWKHVRKGTSAGRVQSVALRLVCEREREIQNFVPVEYWNLEALFRAPQETEPFRARLSKLDGKKPKIGDVATAAALVRELEAAAYSVTGIEKTPRKQKAPPPFITSTLQQAAGSALHFSTSQTMRTAQQLYEGLDLGTAGATGLITYMRTDSVAVAKEAQDATRAFIEAEYGPDFVPKHPNVYRSRKSAQEAHEAIRPTDVRRTPDSVARHLSRPQLRLYQLIWRRFVASQMAPARHLDHAVEVTAAGAALTHEYLFRATARQTTFPGYLTVYDVKAPDQETDEEACAQLPELAAGMPCDLQELCKEQCFTEPPRRFSEATLVRELEQNGIGRPSTYAAIVNTIQTRDYVSREKGRLVPTALGFAVNDFLVQSLPALFDVGFTASMESHLDEVEEGKLEWTVMLADFYSSFREWLADESEATAPGIEAAAAFLECFPEDITWDPPTRRGRRTYDDKKFFGSLRDQMIKDKRLSDKQWAALLGLAARYRDQIPGLRSCAAKLGILPQLEAQLTRVENGRQVDDPAPRDLELLDALAAVTWEAPVRRGRRSFNDRKFHRSLREQVQAGCRLTPAQEAALKRLIIKYRQQVPNFSELAQKHSLQAPENGNDTSPEELAALLAAAAQIQTWTPPRKRGSRTYDDQKFVDSIRQQYEQRGTLSGKQLGALRRLLGRYHEQIPAFRELAAKWNLTAGNTRDGSPTPVEAKCPECGAPLVKRSGRGKPFFGCSAFPKCRYTAATLPPPPAE